MFLVTYPDIKTARIMIVLHNLPVPTMAKIMPILFDKVPNDTAIMVSANRYQWARNFLGAYWIVDTPVAKIDDGKQFIIDDHNLEQICNDLIEKINII